MNDYVSISQLLGRYTIDIPGNGIDLAGQDKIQSLLCEWGLGKIPDIIPLPKGSTTPWIWDWKVGGKGEYIGTIPKRIGKLVWQARGIKLSAEQLTELGNIGAAHSGRHCKYWFDIVDHTDWGRTDFGQPSDCCFWGCHASAKDMILENGGGAIRFFHNESYSVEVGFARAWLAPWEDCWIVFNGYGLETLPIARILAAQLNHSYYRRIALKNNGCSDGDLWINGGAGYLVGPQESVLRWKSIDLEWEEESQLKCECCDCNITAEEHWHSPSGEDYCEYCYDENVFHCGECGEDYWIEGQSSPTPDGELRCRSCWEESCFECEDCGENTWKRNEVLNSDGESFCGECYYERFAHCDDCCEELPINDAICRDNGCYCTGCSENHPEKEKAMV
jgi:hypothetical protein